MASRDVALAVARRTPGPSAALSTVQACPSRSRRRSGVSRAPAGSWPGRAAATGSTGTRIGQDWSRSPAHRRYAASEDLGEHRQTGWTPGAGPMTERRYLIVIEGGDDANYSRPTFPAVSRRARRWRSASARCARRSPSISTDCARVASRSRSRRASRRRTSTSPRNAVIESSPRGGLFVRVLGPILGPDARSWGIHGGHVGSAEVRRLQGLHAT